MELSVDERAMLDPNGVLTTADWVSANAGGDCVPSQSFGELAARYGIEALLVPSSVIAGALVVVLFTDLFQEQGRSRVQATD